MGDGDGTKWNIFNKIEYHSEVSQNEKFLKILDIF